MFNIVTTTLGRTTTVESIFIFFAMGTNVAETVVIVHIAILVFTTFAMGRTGFPWLLILLQAYSPLVIIQKVISITTYVAFTTFAMGRACWTLFIDGIVENKT